MKIVCDACQAKYSISDDKVQGKVFKIRCKKCSNIIVVRGGAGAAEPAPAPPQEKDTRVYDYGYEGGDQAPTGDDAVWHVVINQDQVGPMTAVEVQRRFARGELDSESYIWREGFNDWLPLAQVDTFAALASPAAPAPRSGGAEAVAAMFGDDDGGAARSDPADLFAAASASSARHDDDSGDLFGAKPVAQSSQGGAKLRGERNENSVLFSLNNLAQLASDKPMTSSTHSSGSSGSLPQQGGGAGGEGSGLIDIRSMASAYRGGVIGSAKPASSGIGSIDDLPVFGGGGFSEPAVIVPIAARSTNNKLVYALIGSVGLLAVAAVVVVVVLLRDHKPAVQVATRESSAVTDNGKEPAAGEPAGAATAGRDPPPAKPVEPVASGSSESVQGAAAPGARGASEPPKPPRVEAGDPPTEPRRAAPVRKATPALATAPTRPRAAPPAPVTERTPTPVAKDPPAAKDGCDEVSCVLNNYEGACCAKYKKARASGGAAPAAKGDVPTDLDRDMIREGVDKVKGRAMGCAKDSVHGQVKVSVRVGPDGRVSNVTVKTTPDEGLGSCVAGVMQKATFARTQNGGSFAYPFTF
jgi:predicted Zn finger-like uncharacterized protein